jgi:hypothetical protein
VLINESQYRAVKLANLVYDIDISFRGEDDSIALRDAVDVTAFMRPDGYDGVEQVLALRYTDVDGDENEMVFSMPPLGFQVAGTTRPLTNIRKRHVVVAKRREKDEERAKSRTDEDYV